MCSALSGLPISCATLAASRVSAWIALALDGLEGFLPRLGGVVQNQRHAGAAGRFAIERRGVEPQEARARILHFELVPHDALAARVVQTREIFSQSSSGRKSVMGWPSAGRAASPAAASRPG